MIELSLKILNLYMQSIINSGPIRFLARSAESSRVNKLAFATIKKIDVRY